jgi:hypothetical protein
MTARIAIVPASAIAAEPGMPLTADAYIQPHKQQEERIACAIKRIHMGHAGLVAVARQRRDIRRRQARLGIQEIQP